MQFMNLLMIIMLFVIPVIALLIGMRTKNNPPKNINKIVGYRTARSMASQEAWDYANRRCGEMMYKGGIYTLIAGVVGTIIILLAKLSEDVVVVSIIVTVVLLLQTILLIFPMRTIEKELRDEAYKK